MYNISNKPEKLTFDWLFDKISQEDVFLRYFGFCDTISKHCNPLRNDSKPDCKFYWHNGILFFNDIAQKKAYTCVSVVMEIEHVTYYTALNKIYTIFLENAISSTIVKVYRPKELKEYKDIKCKIQPFTKIDIEYLKLFGITSRNCKMFQVYSIKHYWLNGEIKYAYNDSNPCIGYYDNGKWKLYFYKADIYRFLTNISHTELQGYDMLPWVGDVCILTKSMKDIIVWYNLGYPAVAPHSEGIAEWKNKLPILQNRFKKIIINFDNDKAGIKATNEVLKEFDLDTFYLPEEKDISGYYKKNGLQKTQELIKEITK
jgi:hypothetical protein